LIQYIEEIFGSFELTGCMKQIATLTGHSLRVLYLALSPDGQVCVKFSKTCDLSLAPRA